MPRPLGFLVVGGSGYVLSALVSYLLPDAGVVAEVSVALASVGEIWMIGYLLVRGVRRTEVLSSATDASVAQTQNTAQPRAQTEQRKPSMTVIWFVVWLIATNVGAHKPLLLDPVNVWTGTLILAIALDLAAANATGASRRRQ